MGIDLSPRSKGVTVSYQAVNTRDPRKLAEGGSIRNAFWSVRFYPDRLGKQLVESSPSVAVCDVLGFSPDLVEERRAVASSLWKVGVSAVYDFEGLGDGDGTVETVSQAARERGVKFLVVVKAKGKGSGGMLKLRPVTFDVEGEGTMALIFPASLSTLTSISLSVGLAYNDTGVGEEVHVKNLPEVVLERTKGSAFSTSDDVVDVTKPKSDATATALECFFIGQDGFYADSSTKKGGGKEIKVPQSVRKILSTARSEIVERMGTDSSVGVFVADIALAGKECLRAKRRAEKVSQQAHGDAAVSSLLHSPLLMPKSFSLLVAVLREFGSGLVACGIGCLDEVAQAMAGRFGIAFKKAFRNLRSSLASYLKSHMHAGTYIRVLLFSNTEDAYDDLRLRADPAWRGDGAEAWLTSMEVLKKAKEEEEEKTAGGGGKGGKSSLTRKGPKR